MLEIARMSALSLNPDPPSQMGLLKGGTTIRDPKLPLLKKKKVPLLMP